MTAESPAPTEAAPGGPDGGPGLPRGRLGGVAAVSASVLLLQLVQTRIFSVMLWHHLTYLVVTFTLLGFAAGGALLACRRSWLKGSVSSRLGGWSVVFGVSMVVVYAVISRLDLQTEHTRLGIATAAINYGALVLPMVFGGMVVALSLSDAGGRVGRVYAWNMGGSALGCVLYVPVLRNFGGEGAVLYAATLAFAAAAAFTRDRDRPSPVLSNVSLVLAAGALALATLAPQLVFEVPVAPSKAMVQHMALRPELRVEHTRWDPIARLDVIGPGPDDPSGQRMIFQDGDAPTVLPMGNVPMDPLAKEGLGYLLFQETAPKVLAIGIGGGIDILQSRAPRSYPDGSRVDFTGVEINASTADLMTDLYADATADRYHLPGVTVHVDEGRSWLRRSDERYDLIQMTGTDTYTALSSGSYVMSESYLYTAEAYDDFLAHLTDDGVISVLRFRFDPPRETLRLAAIAVEALRRDGAESPADHMVALGIEGGKVTLADGTNVGLDYGVLLIRKRPFRPDEVDMYRRYAAAHPQIFVMAAPGVETAGTWGEYFAAVRAGTDDDFRARYAYNLDPVDDDSPFFFRYHRWENVWGHLFGEQQVSSDEYMDVVGGEPIGLIMLFTVLAESVVLVAALVLVPLLLFRREGLKTRGAGRWGIYFFGLGAGYILVEIVAMQRFVLFLGHPGYAITVVLVTFLLFSGVGAAVAGRSGDPRRTLVRALLAVILGIAALAFGLQAFFEAALLFPLPARVLLTVVILAPIAFVMGMPFPSGLALISRRDAPLVPWAFGINGGASVIASVAGILVAMAAGFSMAFVVAAGAYLLALLAGRTADA